MAVQPEPQPADGEPDPVDGDARRRRQLADAALLGEVRERPLAHRDLERDVDRERDAGQHDTARRADRLLRGRVTQASAEQREDEQQAAEREHGVRRSPASAVRQRHADDEWPDRGANAVAGVQQPHELPVRPQRDGGVEPGVHPAGAGARQRGTEQDDGPLGCGGDEAEPDRGGERRPDDEALDGPPRREASGSHCDDEVAERHQREEHAEVGERTIEVVAHVRPRHAVPEVGEPEDHERDGEDGPAGLSSRHVSQWRRRTS
jgi:hypothetical protein